MKQVSPEISFPELEEEILKFWEDNNVFLRSMDNKLSKNIEGEESSSEERDSYVFYDGPPFATGLPHYGHLLAGTIKDVIGRYFTMKGFHVDRRFGWDCHGVPVEFEIQKSLDLHGAKAIREFGVDKFNEECRSIVDRYSQEWRRFVKRSGRWVDLEREYRTMDPTFMESVWWAFKTLWEKGYVYESFKNVSYSPAISTPISNFEANLNYKQVQDPALTVQVTLQKAPIDGLEDLPVRVYVWTTTPWTLPSNTAIAVNRDINYAVLKLSDPSEYAIIAESRLSEYFPELAGEEEGKKKSKNAKPSGRDAELVKVVKGASLEGVSYTPFFNFFEKHREDGAFVSFHGDFVSAEEGTGIVHLASFGEDDLGVFLANDLPIIDPIDEDGVFTDEVGPFADMYFKDANPEIISALKENGRLVRHDVIEHSYPFCWRTDKPLIYKSISTWFVSVEKIKEQLIENNQTIHWVPEHVKNGRFGKWLENARDWAISRNRFWGTPIPLWKGEDGELYCVGSISELEELSGKKVTDLHTHRIDDVTITSPKTGKTLTRIPEVLDCWFESGAMPYAQAHYPFENKEAFESNFPADFIAEGLDQTRGWFYTLLVLSTALFEKPAFKNVIVNGIILAEDGRKMSKSLKNYPPADEIMNSHGADALRLYMLASAATKADELKFSEVGIREVIRQTLIPLWNAHNFFVTYALVDGWKPSDISDQVSDNLLDQWILSKLATTTKQVDAVLSDYRLYAAAQPILDFIDQLTNWYIRLNRRRFWLGNTEEEKKDKANAYATLYTVLTTFSRVIAPLAPFVSDAIFRNLTSTDDSIQRESVHLTPFPSAEGIEIHESLEQAMELFEEAIVLGRALRNEHEVKLRQPLSSLTVVYGDQHSLDCLKLLDSYLRDELNVKEVIYEANEEKFVSLAARLNTIKLGKTLGPKLGKSKMSELHKLISTLSTEEIRSLEAGSTITFEEEVLGRDDILISRQPKPELKTAASSGRLTIQLNVALTPELRLEGLAREFVNRIQKLRKDSGFDVADRIVLSYMTACNKVTSAIREHEDYIAREVLAVDIIEASSQTELESYCSEDSATILDVDGSSIAISICRRQS